MHSGLKASKAETYVDIKLFIWKSPIFFSSKVASTRWTRIHQSEEEENGGEIWHGRVEREHIEKDWRDSSAI